MVGPHRPVILVSAAASREAEAQRFCSAFGFEYCCQEKLYTTSIDTAYILWFSQQRVEILSCLSGNAGPVYVDFASAKTTYRRKYGGGRNEMLARAIGLRKGVSGLRVVDATAGMGQDAFLLASLGCHVTMFERHPVAHCLLADGLQRAQSSAIADFSPTLGLLELRFGVAEFSYNAEVAYLDPMFPKNNQGSRVNKAMTVFKDIVGEDSDSALLLDAALQSNVKRVVVKRPRLAEPLGPGAPTYQIVGKSSRYDIYAKHTLRKKTRPGSD